MTGRLPWWLVPGVLVWFVLGACGDGSTVRSGDVAIHVHPVASGDGMDAQIVGELGVRDGCVVLQEADAWFPVVWPHGTTIASSDPLVLRLPSGDEVAIGDGVIGGGGYLWPDVLDVDIPEECVPPSEEIAVFNPDDSPTVTPTL